MQAEAARALRDATPGRNVPADLVYTYPTISALTAFASAPDSDVAAQTLAEKTAAMHALVEKYTRDLPVHKGSSPPVPGEGAVVLLTGTTGGLGASVLGIAYNADSVPWCGLFVATCMAEAGIAPPPIAVRASSWDAFGEPARPFVGAVLRFDRPGGGHVGFAVGEDATRLFVLGGNQGDRVSIVPIDKARLVACRAPAGFAGPRLPLPAMSGAASSRDEA